MSHDHPHDHGHDHSHGHSHDHAHDHSHGPELSPQEMEERLKAYQVAQQVYLEETFRWLIEYVASYFPEDRLVVRDLDLEVHFVHEVSEGGKPLGALVYRLRKFQNKKEYFKEMAEDYREGLNIPEVLFVDTESTKFEAPTELGADESFWEIPQDKLTGKIRELRDELKRKAKLKKLRESV
jgi:hypothetical protein